MIRPYVNLPIPENLTHYGRGTNTAPDTFNASISAAEYPDSARISSVCCPK